MLLPLVLGVLTIVLERVLRRLAKVVDEDLRLRHILPILSRLWLMVGGPGVREHTAFMLGRCFLMVVTWILVERSPPVHWFRGSLVKGRFRLRVVHRLYWHFGPLVANMRSVKLLG